MNIAANQAIYPQTATHMPYPNGAIIPSHMQQTASIVGRVSISRPGCAHGLALLGILSTHGTDGSWPIDVTLQFSWSSVQHSSPCWSSLPTSTGDRNGCHVQFGRCAILSTGDPTDWPSEWTKASPNRSTRSRSRSPATKFSSLSLSRSHSIVYQPLLVVLLSAVVRACPVSEICRCLSSSQTRQPISLSL